MYATLFRAILGFSAFIFATQLYAGDNKTKQEMAQHLIGVKNIFDAQYAPSQWKRDHYHWDIDTIALEAVNEIQNREEVSIKDYQKILRNFFQSAKDYHVGVYFYSTEFAFLPFQIKSAEGKYFITAIDKNRLSKDIYKIKVGDELITFDGQPIDQAVEEFKKSNFRDVISETDQSTAELFFTLRIGAMGMDVPKGSVSIEVKSHPSGKETSYQLIWSYNPEKIKSGSQFNFFGKSEKSLSPKFLYAQMSHPIRELGKVFRVLSCDFNVETSSSESSENRAEDVNTEQEDKVTILSIEESSDSDSDEEDFPQFSSHPNAFGPRSGYLPDLGEIIWRSSHSTPFDAYIYLSPTGNSIGYIRIPHYVLNTRDVHYFASVIRRMQKQTDALVIDQLNNPGGSVFASYALASMLSEHSLNTPKQCIKITQNNVAEAQLFFKELSQVKSNKQACDCLGADLTGYPVNYQVAQFCKNFYEFVINEWNRGSRFTKPYFLYGVDHINPYPNANYTKPILLLINGLDFSCGDLFPAILQDNQRAVTMGSKTAGAGGFICYADYPNRFGVKSFTYTGSIAERMDHTPIEDLGVTPDIPYTVTANDLQNNYSGFANAINQVVDGLIVGDLSSSEEGIQQDKGLDGLQVKQEPL
jgi:hypothetical protein